MVSVKQGIWMAAVLTLLVAGVIALPPAAAQAPQAAKPQASKPPAAKPPAAQGEKTTAAKTDGVAIASLSDVVKTVNADKKDNDTDLRAKILKTLDGYGRTSGYDVIFDTSIPASPVLWASTETVVTQQLEKTYPTGVTGAAAAAKSAAPHGVRVINLQDVLGTIHVDSDLSYNEIGQNVMKVVDHYARQNGYSLVLSVSEADAYAPWTSHPANITREIIKAYRAAPASLLTGPAIAVPGADSMTAAPGTAPAGIRITNIQDAIVSSREGKQEFAALQQRFAPKQQELKALQDELVALEQRLKSGNLSDADKTSTVSQAQSKQQELQQKYQAAQQEFQGAEKEVVNRIGNKMLGVTEKFAKENGVAVIVDVSNPQSPVLWAAPGMNITKQLLERYDAQSPAAPPATK